MRGLVVGRYSAGGGVCRKRRRADTVGFRTKGLSAAGGGMCAPDTFPAENTERIGPVPRPSHPPARRSWWQAVCPDLCRSLRKTVAVGTGARSSEDFRMDGRGKVELFRTGPMGCMLWLRPVASCGTVCGRSEKRKAKGKGGGRRAGRFSGSFWAVSRCPDRKRYGRTETGVSETEFPGPVLSAPCFGDRGWTVTAESSARPANGSRTSAFLARPVSRRD